MEMTIPAQFAGPIPHAHDEFDESIYVLSGRLLVVGDDEPEEAGPGSMFVAPRGQRHGFSNPFAEQALVLGIWAPPQPGLAFMREIGGALVPGAPPDPERMREIYARHASRLLP
jgi:mannose-6-phosphate isomerase-like protein (cupin superfamily)